MQLNERNYDTAPLSTRAIAHYRLVFEDCSSPPAHIVAAFLTAVDAAGNQAIAVHCRAGLGRTGTLIAVWLMRSAGFSAREAIGWLRIMRPGSVIGEQQHFLCALDASLMTSGMPSELGGPSCRPCAATVAAHDAHQRPPGAFQPAGPEEAEGGRGSSTRAELGEVVALGAARRSAARMAGAWTDLHGGGPQPRATDGGDVAG